MKAQDIVDKLAANIPLYSAGFSESVGITSIVPTATTALVTTDAAHELDDGQNAAIIGADAPVQIDTATFLRTGSQAVFETLQDHDLTLSQLDIASGGKTITISGATEAEFNGTFQLIQIPNRRKIIIVVADAGPTTISGSPIVENANGGIFNGLFPITLINATQFEYTLPVSYTLPAAVSNAKVQTSIRIASVLDIDQYLQDLYTKQLIGDHQLIVQLGDVTQSKKRNEETDASSSTTGEYSFTPILIQPFAIYIVMNASQDLTASQLRDKVEEEFVPAIFNSVLRAQFGTGFTYSQYRATFTGHGVYGYSDETGKNKAVYAHEVTFEQLSQLCREDMVGSDDNVAMRDVSYTLTTDLGTGELTADINLDEETS
ncbi:MAG: hypothetical protein KAT69_01685 [Candidatus Aminicenantes bacterium]|nr:hypothetical protein [Candidatus Aminicenantes bacterium]